MILTLSEKLLLCESFIRNSPASRISNFTMIKNNFKIYKGHQIVGQLTVIAFESTSYGLDFGNKTLEWQLLWENLWTIIACAFCSSSFRPWFSPSVPLKDTNFGCHCWNNKRKLFKIQVNFIKAFYSFKKWMCAFHFVARWFRQKMRVIQHFWTVVGQILCLGIPGKVHIIFNQQRTFYPRVYIASSKQDGRWENSRLMKTLDRVSGLQNCPDFFQLLKCLDEAM